MYKGRIDPTYSLHPMRKGYEMTKVIETESGPFVRLFGLFIIFTLRKGEISYSVV